MGVEEAMGEEVDCFLGVEVVAGVGSLDGNSSDDGGGCFGWNTGFRRGIYADYRSARPAILLFTQVFFKAEFLGKIYLTAFLKGFSLTATRTRTWAPSPPVTYLIFASNFISHCAKYTKSLVESVLGHISCLSLPASIAIAWTPISLADCT